MKESADTDIGSMSVKKVTAKIAESRKTMMGATGIAKAPNAARHYSGHGLADTTGALLAMPSL
jgi:hypothetical protein